MASGPSISQKFLSTELESLAPPLTTLILSLSRAVADISTELRTISSEKTGTPNQFGDAQIQADVRTDEIIVNRLIESGVVETAASEEYPMGRKVAGKGFNVAFDPLDGSSVLKSNLTVGTIFGVWKGESPIGQYGRDQVCAAYGVYGPKTLFVITRPVSDSDSKMKVQEFVLVNDVWCLSRDEIKIEEEKICAPANFRSATDSTQYQSLIQHWMEQNYLLRYGGAMVADIHNILSSNGGVYCFPSSPLSPTRLRLIYECAPMALIVESAGGASYNDSMRSLDQLIGSYDDKCTIFIGSKELALFCQKHINS